MEAPMHRSTRTSQLILVSALALVGCSSAAPHEEAPETAARDTGPVTAASLVSGQASPGTQDVSQELDQSRTTAIVRAAERVAPAVVSISVIRTEQVRQRTFFETRFMPRRTAGFGSGVIVRDDGIILTNDHVIVDADQIRVTLPGGVDYEAELIGTDPLSDIAVLRITGDDLPVAPVGTSRGLMIGEWALAIGNPLGNYIADSQPTVTAGVVSAVERNITPGEDDRGFYFGMIQTDASINPGNSGGPLVNAAGEVIGINASIISRGGGSEGLGFAIPIDRALRIADDLFRTGEVSRAWVGLDVGAVEADPWGRTRGVRITQIANASPASTAALAPGDRLLSANGRALTGPLDFEGVLLDLRAGDPLVLEVEGQARPISLTTSDFPSRSAERVTVLRDIQVISVSPQIRAERGLSREWGALITNITPELAARLGLQEGDVILQINRSPVRSADDLAAYFNSLRGSGQVAIYFERDGNDYVRQFYWRG